MAGSVSAIGKGREWWERAAPCLDERASQQKELGWWSRGRVAGRPAWSRAVPDRNARRRDRAFGYDITASECGRANPRFEPTPRHGKKSPRYEDAMNSLERTAVLSPVLSRVMAARHPATRGSSTSRSASRAQQYAQDK